VLIFLSFVFNVMVSTRQTDTQAIRWPVARQAQDERVALRFTGTQTGSEGLRDIRQAGEVRALDRRWVVMA
jgi:hypothetical protein